MLNCLYNLFGNRDKIYTNQNSNGLQFGNIFYAKSGTQGMRYSKRQKQNKKRFKCFFVA